jgi:hypothetical protein
MQSKVHRLNEAELKARLFGKNVSADKELIWNELSRKGWVKDCCNGELALADIEDEIASLEELLVAVGGREKTSGKSKHRYRGEVVLTRAEEEYAATLASYLARRAALLPEVREFREEKLGGMLEVLEYVPEFLRRELQWWVQLVSATASASVAAGVL